MKKLSELGISPAPWKIDECSGGWNIVQDAKGKYVVTPDGDEETEAVSNAHLIAAAPELYDAAERYIRFHEESCIHGNRSANEIFADHRKAYEDLKAALAKAGGEEEQK